MNGRLDAYVLGWLLALIGAFQALPMVAAVAYGEPLLPWVASAGVAAVSGGGIVASLRPRRWVLRPRDGFLVVGVGWLVVSIAGAVPYVALGVLGPIDAFFESVSGFTTTGSTVMTGLESQARSLLLWRSFTQWIGGMGIILFTIAILPLLGIGGMQLFKAEVPGPVADKVAPRLVETARRLWLVYVGFTVAETAALTAAGMSLYEASCHAFTTLATGGFSTRDLSVGAFESATIEWIITFFMLCAGMNFVLHYRLLSGRGRRVIRDGELRYYLGLVVVAVALVTGTLLYSGEHAERALRLGAFQVASLLTTTGYATADFEQWAPLAHVVLLTLMVLGGMSGSTSGGVKSLRALLGVRALNVSFERLLHPHVVRSVKYAGQRVADDVLAGIWAFFTAYAMITLLGALVVSSYGYDLETSFSAALTAIGNVGPGLGEVGAYDNFAGLPGPAKLVLAGCMLAGRLEIFTLALLFVPRFWRR